MKIHLFSQCLIDMFYPHVGMAGVQVLERLGCDITVPKKASMLRTDVRELRV